MNEKSINDFAQKNGWQIKSNSLYKRYSFKDFKVAINFIVELSKFAEAKNHHPKIINSYSIVEIFWKTNDLNAITKIDCQLASQCDQTYLKMIMK